MNDQANQAAGLDSRIAVLVVDDEEIAVESVAEYLERKGCRVESASNGSAALDLFDANPFDVVITDLRMPQMDGNELVLHIRERNTAIPIIVTTGHTSIGDELEIVSEGASAVLRKPIRLRELMQLIEELTGRDLT